METIRIPENSHRSFASAALASSVVLMLATMLPVRTARALPIYAARDRASMRAMPCQPYGSGPRTAFGRAFAANGHRLPGGHGHGSRARPRYGYPRGDYRHHGGMMDGYGPHGDYGPGMMGGYGPGMMGW